MFIVPWLVLQAFIDFVHHILASKRWNTWNLYITISDGV